MNDAAPADRETTSERRQGIGAPLRLAEGGMIDRSTTLAFTFDGSRYLAHRGDTLASALVANGVRLVGRSFKYHRPRGILSAGPEEPNALVELRSGARREPNTRATIAEIYDGLEAMSQNRWPSLRYDLLSINGLLGPALAAGFYYKTFMWPASWWEKVYEPLIRRAAGLGRASGVPDPDTYEKAHLHCDVLVIGSGPAGLMAALTAARSGARVVLAEEDFRLGGRLILDNRIVADQPSAAWVASIEAELATMPQVRILRRTAVFGSYDHGTFAAIERVNDHIAIPPVHEARQRLWRIIANRCVLAAGAIERPLVFANNDRPGVMLAGAVRAYVNRFAALPGRRAVVFASNDDAARTIDDLSHHGVDVAAVIDPRPDTSTIMAASAKSASAVFVAGGSITRVLGRLGVEGVDVRQANGQSMRLACDLVCVSGGWSPSLHLTSHRGNRPEWSDKLAAFIPGRLQSGMAVAGSANGDHSLASAFETGARAGREAAAACGFDGAMPALPSADASDTTPAGSQPRFAAPSGAPRGKAFVDFQNDVTVGDIDLAQREGFRSVEHMKRYTTLGMATDQGKTSNVNGLTILAGLTGRTIPETGTTTFRPPYQPVAIGALAGHHRGREFRPTRLPPTHAWAMEQGAVFVESGAWLRAQWYPSPGENDWLESVNREVKAVRSSVGVCDVSTLGKIDVSGPDAGLFLDRLYTGVISSLPVGRARYGLMLREDGFVMDDGTASRFALDHFVVTTTTANAGKVMAHMELCQQWLWPELDVQLVSTSDQWAQLSVAGPRSRDVLRGIVDAAHDISNDAFPHLAARDITALGGIPARLFRISYSGELAYEIAVPAGFGDTLVRRIMEAGRDHGITPYGTETLGVLRIEKGHVAGNEISGQTTAADLGLGRMLSRKKDFIGRVMCDRPGMLDPRRPTLVGLKPIDIQHRLRAGSHLIAKGAEPVAANDQGYITSVAYSPTLGHWIGLGLLSGGLGRHGQHVRVWDPVRSGDVLAEVCDPVFYDSKGERLHG
jgi:sarcosine oxidase subunit alpha